MFKDKRHMIEFFVGIALVLSMILFGVLYNTEKSMANLSRVLIGGTIGYALARAAFGFAGSVNRASSTGSTKLMKSMLVLFLMGAAVTFVMVLGGFDVTKLSHNGLNWGLLVGATLFGFGMALTVCCASGALTDLAESPIKGIAVLFFFCGGAFLGLGVKTHGGDWYKQPIFGIPGAEKGVNFTDWFKWDGTNGVLMSLILTALLVLGFWVLAHLYENHRKKKGTYTGCACEIAIDEEFTRHEKSEKVQNEVFYTLFVKPWSLTRGAAVIALGYAMLMIIFNSSWGVSGPLGQWFGRMLHLFGVPTENLMWWSGLGESVFTSKFFDNAMYIQDLSIFLGALVAFLLAGNFSRNYKSWLFNPLELVLFLVGGVCLGIAINLAGGCNAGGLFSPIAQFSLSGWIYLICIIGGGFLGNLVRKEWTKLYKFTSKTE